MVTATLVDEDGTHAEAGVRQVTVGRVLAALNPSLTLVDLIVSGSTWSGGENGAPDFIDAVDGAGYGAGNRLGLSLIDQNSTRNLPWASIDTIYLVFSQDIGSFTADDFTLTGVSPTAFGPVGDYSGMIGSVSYDASPPTLPIGTFIATITLNVPLGTAGTITHGDKLLLSLPNTVFDTNGNGLGDVSLRFNVLPGDANDDDFVLGDDILAINAVRSTFAPLAGFTDPNYDPFRDLDADGIVLGPDVLFANQRRTEFLPFGEPKSAVSSNAGLAAIDSFYSDLGDDDEDDELTSTYPNEIF